MMLGKMSFAKLFLTDVRTEFGRMAQRQLTM